jgi:hypothetical protein
MKMRTLYIILCVVGTILPYWQGMEFSREHGMDMAAFVRMAAANSASRYIGLDLLVTALVFIVFLVVEGKRLALRRLWLPVIATFLVGVSLGLPMFLAMRENRVSAKTSNG